MRKFILPTVLILVATAISVSYLLPEVTTIVRQPTGVFERQENLPYPTVESIFSSDHTFTATLSAQHITTILVTGDIIPARTVNSQVLKYSDYKWPYLKTKDITSAADITFVNLETPLIKDCPVTNEGMIFCGDSRNIEGLAYSGADVVSIANNHAGNWGEEGVLETARYLKEKGIGVTGTSEDNIVVKEKNGTRFAFLGFNDISSPQPGVSNASEEKLKKDIANARALADVVIVQFHWGAEYRDTPDERQKYLGHFAIDSGADLVIGNHPHWVQPVEFYKGKLITYAHGNFVFDQMWSQETREGVLGTYVFYKDKLIDVSYLPIQIDDFGQPKVITNTKQKDKILQNMRKHSF